MARDRFVNAHSARLTEGPYMHLVGGSCSSFSIPIITSLANLPFVDSQSLECP